MEAGHDLRQRALADPSWLLATIEHRRWCAQQLLRGMRPLLALPVAMDPRQWHEDDRRKADDWFGSREAKQAWRLRGYHIDLMSFESLACFDALEGRAGQGGIEQENDLTISRMTDYIIDGRVPAA